MALSRNRLEAPSNSALAKNHLSLSKDDFERSLCYNARKNHPSTSAVGFFYRKGAKLLLGETKGQACGGRVLRPPHLSN
jgi:hypothetical protein